MRLRRPIMSIVVLTLAAGACSTSATPTPPPASAPAATASEGAGSPGAEAASPSAEAASPSAEAASPSAEASPSGPPPSLAPTTSFTFRGDKTANSKPFAMSTPALVSWSSNGPGPFNAVVVPVSGVNNISTGTIADVTGRTSGTTWIYGEGSSTQVTINVTASATFGVTVMSPVPPTVLSMPANFNGAFGMTTQPFSATGDVTITYSTQGGDFDVTLVDATTGYSVVHVASASGPTQSSTVIHDLNGAYAFDVTSTGRWTIQVKGP